MATSEFRSNRHPEVLRVYKEAEEKMLAIAKAQTEPINYFTLGEIFDDHKHDNTVIPSIACWIAFWNLIDKSKLTFTPDRRIILAPTAKPQ